MTTAIKQDQSLKALAPALYSAWLALGEIERELQQLFEPTWRVQVLDPIYASAEGETGKERRGNVEDRAARAWREREAALERLDREFSAIIGTEKSADFESVRNLVKHLGNVLRSVGQQNV